MRKTQSAATTASVTRTAKPLVPEIALIMITSLTAPYSPTLLSVPDHRFRGALYGSLASSACCRDRRNRSFPRCQKGLPVMVEKDYATLKQESNARVEKLHLHDTQVMQGLIPESSPPTFVLTDEMLASGKPWR